jgi:lipopolysaccharide/colanic/teichoic acid biosynthesis glycosyltransferase
LALALGDRVPSFKLQSDPRLTRIGALLRRFSLDGLPRFWNVPTGETGIVGPARFPSTR